MGKQCVSAVFLHMTQPGASLKYSKCYLCSPQVSTRICVAACGQWCGAF